MSGKIDIDWCADFPGSADLNFHFRRLMDSCPDGLGTFETRQITPPRIAVIGAGAAGLTAVRELLRSGVSNVDLYEASGRYGGRFWTKTLPDHEGQDQFSTCRNFPKYKKLR